MPSSKNPKKTTATVAEKTGKSPTPKTSPKPLTSAVAEKSAAQVNALRADSRSKTAVTASEPLAAASSSVLAEKKPGSRVTVVAPASAAASRSAERPVNVPHQEIAHLAHALWVKRGYPHGSHEQDWHEAERQLKAASAKH